MNKILISVIGPTAIGKTKLAILLAKHFKTEIISADSRQFFKEMNIGTAVPDVSELKEIPHHFIQHKSVTENYTVGDFEREALEKLAVLFETNDVTIMVGGSGLYINAVKDGLNSFPTVDPSIREQLNLQLQEQGITSLQDALFQLDPVYFKKVDIHNPQRVIRALEIGIGSGKPYSSFIDQPKMKRDFTVLTVGLRSERPILYQRINDRVDEMVKEGLLEEVYSLLKYSSHNALQTVGYKELFQYFEGEWTLEFAISEIKKNTRRFAKRQMTWFSKNSETLWFDYNAKKEVVLSAINHQITTLKNG